MRNRRIPEEEMEQIMDLSAREQVVLYSQMYSCGDVDMMVLLDATGAFNSERGGL